MRTRSFFPIWSKLRLSSKNHVDVPIRVGAETLHILASHPTPPVFDGPADHNGCRNHDEVRFWIDLLKVVGSGVHWPPKSDPQSREIDASDHRMVWVDLILSWPDR